MSAFGLIGFPLSHSFSATYFLQKFEKEDKKDTYKNFPVTDLETLHDLIRQNDLKGFNVTIPYKEKIIPLLDEIDEQADRIGAVNCVVVRNGKLFGYNTDIIGFEHSLLSLFSSHDLEIKNYRALIFGTGGASKAAAFVLNKINIPFLLAGRNKQHNTITYAEVDEDMLDKHKPLINTTPVGMYPMEAEALLLPYKLITPQHVAYDMIYNPSKTLFLCNCEKQMAIIKNGLEMLQIQAEESYRLFCT